MPFPEAIQDALHVYDQNKGFWRRLFRRDQAAIRLLRSLSETDQSNYLKPYYCFIENLPKPTQASYQVYLVLLAYLKQQNLSDVPKAINQLFTAKLLNPSYLEKLSKLEANQFQALAKTLEQLNSYNLLTQANFDAIADCVHLNVFNNMAQAIDKLNKHDCLNQTNLNYFLEKSPYFMNIAIILIALKETDLLTSENLRHLDDPENQSLLSDEACEIVWSPLKKYLNKLLVDKTNQTILDSIINLAKQKKTLVQIEDYLNNLNSETDTFRRQRSQKYPTFHKSTSQDRLLNSDETSALTRSGTL